MAASSIVTIAVLGPMIRGVAGGRRHFRRLFESPAFDALKVFVWRNPVASPEQVAELKALRPKVRVQIVRSSAAWV
jgi:hypothetical protein